MEFRVYAVQEGCNALGRYRHDDPVQPEVMSEPKQLRRSPHGGNSMQSESLLRIKEQHAVLIGGKFDHFVP